MKSPLKLNTSGLLRNIADYCNKAYAEREGFEPPEGSSPSAVFKTAAINRSAISPRAKIEKRSTLPTMLLKKIRFFLTAEVDYELLR